MDALDSWSVHQTLNLTCVSTVWVRIPPHPPPLLKKVLDFAPCFDYNGFNKARDSMSLPINITENGKTYTFGGFIGTRCYYRAEDCSNVIFDVVDGKLEHWNIAEVIKQDFERGI